jgi:hypothetical protein
LERVAISRKIEIREPFQGTMIGYFLVLAPSRQRYLDLIVESERTPESVAESRAEPISGLAELLQKAAANAIAYVKASWGQEMFSKENTSAENEMSVVQYAWLCEKRILLTADTGRSGLAEAADYAQYVGVILPGIDRIQIPHHGSRRNVSTEALDRWLGARLPSIPTAGRETFTAIVSSAKADEDHPRKAVVRAFIHRGAKVITTKGNSVRISQNAPQREGWVPVQPVPYPEEQEQD